MAASAEPQDDVWIRTCCDYCHSNCPVIVHRVNRVVVKIDGDPDTPYGGRLCAKGQAALMTLYDPQRITTPLKRTNPDKGIGIDPNFIPISWAEALDTVAQRLRQIREDDPRKLVLYSFDVQVRPQVMTPWANAFGTPNVFFTTFSCINVHPITYLVNGTFEQEIDLDYCDYCILIGDQSGFMAGINANLLAQKMADARMRGMKLVVVDPVGSNAAAKADEWIPIRPGTDGALALAMLNLLLNEYNLYDAHFLKARTNAPYLIGPDGSYVRDKARGKPLVWDQGRDIAAPFDVSGVDPALTGRYRVEGVACQPAFHLLKEHVERYTPELAAEITTVPAATIRHLAREFGEAARIGAKIAIEGKELPYRPAAVECFTGVLRHAHANLAGLSVMLLNLVVGNMYVPGGYQGVNLVGPGGRWRERVEEDGLLVPPLEVALQEVEYYSKDVRAPDSLSWLEMLPFGFSGGNTFFLNLLEPERLGRLSHLPEAALIARQNILMTGSGAKEAAEVLRRIPFVVCFAQELDETVEFADVVFPDTHQLERLHPFPQRMRTNVSPASGQFYWGIQQPVVEPPPGVRSWGEVLLELADRVGFREDLNIAVNTQFRLRGELALDPAKSYAYAEMADRWVRAVLGPDRGIDYLKAQGVVTRQRTVEERYPLAEIRARFPVYFEIIQRQGEKVRAVAQELGYPIDTGDYVALPDWKPCPSYEPQDPDFDLFAVNYKIPVHFGSVTARNPWLMEVSERHPYFHKALINTETASRKGIRDGDDIWVESAAGRQKAMAKVTECVHPEVVAIAGVLGGWSKGKGAGRGKGVHFGSLLEMDSKRMDWVSLATDGCVRVKVSRAT